MKLTIWILTLGTMSNNDIKIENQNHSHTYSLVSTFFTMDTRDYKDTIAKFLVPLALVLAIDLFQGWERLLK